MSEILNIREYLKTSTLLFDGAMGTYLASKEHRFQSTPEMACLEEPALVKEIHREYLESGARAIKTNTFGANRQNFPEHFRAMIQSGYALAKSEADKSGAYVFADIGPADENADQASGNNAPKAHEILTEVADLFLENGATNFLFETNSSAAAVLKAAEHIKSKCPDSFIIASFAVLPDGFTRDGIFTSDLVRTINQSPAIDAFGLNCAQGAVHMLEEAKRIASNITHSMQSTQGVQTPQPQQAPKLLSLMPNAGYPIVLGHRTVYEGDPALFAQNLAQMASLGAKILGGCCGTTPVHIQKIAQALAQTKADKAEKTKTEQSPSESPAKAIKSAAEPTTQSTKPTEKPNITPNESPFWAKLQKGKKVIAVELDPPENTNADKFMKGASQLKEAGADIITIADCPIARARMDSSLLSCKVKRELDMEALPHMTCRDRNLNATKALILGLYSEGVRNVLLVTGDPIPTAQRDEVKSVYQFNSRKLAAFVSGLNQQALPEPMHIFGALNINARNFDVQLRLAKDKMQHGMVGFLTQPVLSETGLENLKRARTELPGAIILGGLIPIVSERNARFMDSEINGISVDPRLFDLYRNLDRTQSENLALDITVRIAQAISPYTDGLYIVTPFQRTSLVSRIITKLR